MMMKSCVELINNFLEQQREDQKSENTIKTYGGILFAFHRWLEEGGGSLSDLTRFDVQAYMKHLESEGKSAATINKDFAGICVFASYMNRSDIVEKINIPRQRRIQEIAPKSLDRNERNKLLRDVERSGNLRDIAITYVLLLTGIRVSELAALNREDVVIGERSGRIQVRRGKGNVARTVPLSAEARLHLKRYLDQRQDDDSALFLSNYKRRISIRAIQHMLKKYGVHPHELRHTFGRELVKREDIATVAELLGHNDINVTRRYSKPRFQDLENAIDRAFS